MAPSTPSSPSLKVALALALLRHRRHPLSPPPSSSAADPDPLLHWKRKAKDRKRELMRLREELKLLQDGVRCEDERPPIASCRCHFFDGCGDGAGGGHWIDEVLRRRFLRLVRWKERRKRVDGSIRRRSFIEFNNENEIERFGTSIEFLVELSDNIMGKGEYDSSFSTFCHQAVDFILASLKNIISSQKESELLEEMANGLIMRLMKRMCTMNDSKLSSDSQFCIQHLIRKLGNEAYFGQRILLSVSEKISIVAESFLFTDPFDDTFPGMHDSMFMMIQLVEFLILDYIKSWMSDERFDKSKHPSLPDRAFRRMGEVDSQSAQGFGTPREHERALYTLHGASRWQVGEGVGPRRYPRDARHTSIRNKNTATSEARAVNYFSAAVSSNLPISPP
ncbi:protein MULTIPOLAR SPINDLE 1 isoform X3 [Ananas comosus]|uniref:Protein MULTIPOLAR SPINDLE 1 isoform X3 n=1 Tax=Ananas comosus TaxID=4615 RepID=A0A6P5FZ49_ANACO|nr:protein MULTIPOLAR SPINDLE 1 isoform X3 [Ananas comosus]